MTVETILIWLNAGVFAGAVSFIPLIGRSRKHFYEPESEAVQEWAYLMDAFFARALLTAILGTIILFLGLTIAKGLLMKGVSAAIIGGFEVGTHAVTLIVLIAGGIGALKQKGKAAQVLKTQAMAPPERQPVPAKLILFAAVAAVYIPTIQRGLNWLHQ